MLGFLFGLKFETSDHVPFFPFFQVMCMQYWPSAKVKSENYGDLNISVKGEEELANFHIRTIRIIYKIGTVSTHQENKGCMGQPFTALLY